MAWEWPPTRTFRAFAKLQQVDARLRPSMNGQMDVVVNKIADAISVPSKAVFTHAGRPVVYVASNGAYKPTEVEILARNPDEVALKGLPAGSSVALAEPGGGKR